MECCWFNLSAAFIEKPIFVLILVIMECCWFYWCRFKDGTTERLNPCYNGMLLVLDNPN